MEAIRRRESERGVERREWSKDNQTGGNGDDKEDVSTTSLHLRVFDEHVMMAIASQTYMFTHSHRNLFLSLRRKLH